MTKFVREKCVLCLNRPSSPKGEHVLPRWLLKMFPSSEGPYSSYVNGEPVRKRDGSPRMDKSLNRITAPMCSSCNGLLDTRFEKPGKPLVRRLFERDANVVFSPAEVRTLGLWFVKTWLLTAHPRAIDSQEGIPSLAWNPVECELCSWMIRDQAPPPGLSVWILRRAEEHGDQPETRYVPLPTVVADGREIEFQVMRAGIRFLDVSLVYHPEWEIEHPLEDEGRALRLWPPKAALAIDFSTLPEIDTREFAG